MDMKVDNISIKDLKPYTKNTKKHDKKQIDNVAESIKQYGFVQPIVIDRDGVIVIGHCRALAAHGTSLEIEAKDVYFIRALDSQKESGKCLFGSGFLLSEKAAAEKAAAEKINTNIWELSEREREITKSLGK